MFLFKRFRRVQPNKKQFNVVLQVVSLSLSKATLHNLTIGLLSFQRHYFLALFIVCFLIFKSFNFTRMTIFSKIIAGQIPAYVIAESEKFIAFLDIAPVKKGHTLVVPKIETDKLFDLPEEYLQELLVFAKPIALSLEKSFPCNRVSILTVGLDVPHAHVHLIPMDTTSDMNLNNKKLQFSPQDFNEIKNRIVQNL